MKNILSRGQREILREFSWSKVLLAFDYDGTLAPIISDPARVKMRQKTRDLLTEVAKHYPVVIISGRAQKDALKLVRGIGILGVVGNHGIEPWQASDQHVAEVQRWLPLLEERVSPFKGVEIENKTFSVAVHYRQSRAKKKARAAILKAAVELGGVRIIGGKQVVNILPQGAPHKGFALERERDRHHCDTALYVGDDETDEDVFSLDQPGRLLSIRVGLKRDSNAVYGIPNQHAIDSLLRLLLDNRREGVVRARGAQ